MVETGTCEQFTWGGCDEEEISNNFASMIDCEMTCKPSKCPPYMCAMYCEHGFKKDANGCDMCECNTCPPEMCMIECEHGFKKDADDCNTCECNGKTI